MKIIIVSVICIILVILGKLNDRVSKLEKGEQNTQWTQRPMTLILTNDNSTINVQIGLDNRGFFKWRKQPNKSCYDYDQIYKEKR